MNRCSRTAIQDPGLSLTLLFLLSMMGAMDYLTGRLAAKSSATRHLPLALGHGSPLPNVLRWHFAMLVCLPVVCPLK
jgi:hypothetical protein